MGDYIEFIYIGFNLFMGVVAFFLLRKKGYLNKKGENLATKEDIKVITKLQETVKNELESLKLNRISFDEEKRNSIVNLSLSLNFLYETTQLLYITDIEDHRINRNEYYLAKVEDEYTEFKINYHKLSLLQDSIPMCLVNVSNYFLLYKSELTIAVLFPKVSITNGHEQLSKSSAFDKTKKDLKERYNLEKSVQESKKFLKKEYFKMLQ